MHISWARLSVHNVSHYTTCVQRGFLCAAREDLMCTLRHSCLTVVRRGLIGDIRCKMIKEREPELHHSVLVRSGNSILFPLESSTKHLHPRTTTTITTTRSSRPSQLREHVVAADMWSRAFRRAVALQGTAGLECWVSSSAQGPPSAGHGELLTDECVWVCVSVLPCQKTPSIPPPPKIQHCPSALSKSTLQNVNSKTLVFFNECTSL